MREIPYLSATEVLNKIKEKELSCEEVMRAILKRVNALQPVINALEQMIPEEEAIKLAKEADEQIRSGKKPGRLHGLPMTVKDAYFVKGFTTSCGNKGILEKNRGKSVEDATVVARLREEGAIIFGMTNVPEMLICPESDNLIYGQTKNPYDLKRTSGGSSGGEGAAVASGCSFMGIGSDGGGSVRVPAHYSGVMGLKPSQRIVPDTGNGFGNDLGLLSQVVTIGPLARSVDDLILCLSIIRGPDGKDPYALPIPERSVEQVNLKSLRIAFYTDDGNRTPTKEIQETVRNAAESLKSHVTAVKEERPNGLEATWPLLWDTYFLGGDRGEGYQRLMKEMKVDTFSPLFQQFLKRAENCEISINELRYRMQAVDRLKHQMLAFFQNYDVILCPVIATPAKFHGQGVNEIEDLTYTMTFNLTGNPAMTVPCGSTEDGVPIGVQVVGPLWRDDIVFRVAKELEKTLGGWKPSALPELKV